MKNKILIIFLFFSFFLLLIEKVFAEELKIQSNNIQSNKKNTLIIFQKNVKVTDKKLNFLETDYAKYYKDKERIETKGLSKITTSENFIIEGKDFIFDNIKGKILSKYPATIKDREGNLIDTEMFQYDRENNIFFSKGKIKIKDIKGNKYSFSEIYIDEKKEKIIGSDMKVFLNDNTFKIDEKNDPRIFSNTLSASNNKSELGKGIFTYCQINGEGKCPAYSIKADKMEYSPAKKTIYYTNAVLKIYDFPIFFFPKFFHPGPTVKRQTGLLPPSFVNSTNLGHGVNIPYFWNIANDKDLTFTSKLFANENPVMLAEYRQDFERSFLILDTSYTEGYKNSSVKKSKGSRNHFFSSFNADLFDNDFEEDNLEIIVQKFSNPTYHKIYKLNTSLVEENLDSLENTFSLKTQTDDYFFSTTFSAYENLNITGNKKYEYLAPYVSYNKRLDFNDVVGFFDFFTDFRVRNYDVDKQTELLVNELRWKSKKKISKLGLENQLKSSFKLVNYNADNTEEFKNENTNSEIKGAIGYLAKIPFFKLNNTNNQQLFTPKLFLRYAPNHSRRVNDKIRLNQNNIFTLDRMDQIDVIESGLSATLGFDYEMNKVDASGGKKDELFSFSIGQIINEKEDTNKPAPLNQRFSDVVGETSWQPNDKIKFSYDFAVDQNYRDLNYSDVQGDLNLGKFEFNINFLEENEHLGKQKYLKQTLNFNVNENNKFSASNKKDLIKNSSEYYNLSYEYLNDCLTAGVLFRREFYTDRDIAPSDTLWFNLSIKPFANNINSPKF